MSDFIRRAIMAIAVAGALAFPAQGQPGSHSEHHKKSDQGLIGTPASIAAEHRELHEVLGRASREKSNVGRTARELEKALAPHFKREEEIATPPLGLLRALAMGAAVPEMRAVLPMTTALEAEMPKMLQQHAAIRVALAKFRTAAVAAKRSDLVRFADSLAAHALQEEEILYPAALLVGRYISKTVPAR